MTEGEMKSIVLLLSVARMSEKALEFAVGQAKASGAELTVLYVIDTNLADEVFDKFTDIGFMGDKPSTQLTEAIMKEFRQRGYEDLGRVQVKAMEEGVAYNPMTVQGDFFRCAMEEIERRKADIVVAVKRKESVLARYFYKSPVDELKKSASCEVVIFEEE
ncbi:MAG: universal stress protein [Thermodesulfobacteriota bacterium]